MHLPGQATDDHGVVQQRRLVRDVRHVGEARHHSLEHLEALVADVAREIVHAEEPRQRVCDFVGHHRRDRQRRAELVGDVRALELQRVDACVTAYRATPS